jgi:ABC-type multidrug transport system fused ATPase/permease subunit
MRRYIDPVRAAASVLPPGDKKKIITVCALQISLSFLDLIGVALIGVIGALSITGIRGAETGNRTSRVLSFLNLENFGFYNQVVILAIVAVFLLISRTALSMYFSQRYLKFLAIRSAIISSNVFSKLISQSILDIQKRNTQETLFIITEGVRRITIGILGSIVFLISDLSLLIVLTAGLFILDPIVAIVSFSLFGFVALFLHVKMSRKSQLLGKKSSELAVDSNRQIFETLTSYRETMVRNRRFHYSKVIENQRLNLSLTDAQLAFMPMISKYVLESAVVLGAFLISALQFTLNDSRNAIATLVIFMAAGSRIGPAIMRVQQGFIQIDIAIGSAGPTLQLIHQLRDVEKIREVEDVFVSEHKGFTSELKVSSLNFSYIPEEGSTITDVSFELPPGKSLAIVGTSGSGKTTLVDLVLGVLEPESGIVTISGKKPLEAIAEWPGAISYVPQTVSLIEGTIRENICMGFASEQISTEHVLRAIDGASLSEFILNAPAGLDTQVGEIGSKISGGERQRIGIARALLTNPKLLILDEATSSLDGETEAEIANAIHTIKGQVTVVMIAHRLSTVRNADLVLYLERGKIRSIGTFEQVRQSIPNFDAQAKLMGL